MKFSSHVIILFLGVFLYACGSSPAIITKINKEEPVVIANDSLEYQIIIIDQGFNLYLNTVAKPEGFYSQSYLENKNNFYVSVWNLRVNTPFTYDPSIYENNIDYSGNVNYGYDVNYKLFNYFEFAQNKYRMRLR